MTRYNKSRLSTFLFSMLILGGFLSYMKSNTGVIKVTGYILSAGSLVALAVILGPGSRDRVLYTLFSTSLMGLITALGIVVSPQQGTIGEILQNLSYPIVLFFLLVVGFRFAMTGSTDLVLFMCVLAVMNGTVACASSLGVLKSIPVLGEITTGRYIFGTNISSSPGLTFNVNYYATTQACFFFSYAWLQEARKKSLSRFDICVLAALFATSLIGSSRGTLVAMMAGLLALNVIIIVAGSSRERRRSIVVVSFAILIAVIAISSYPDVVYSVFRLERGLNYRDVIWRAGLSLWAERPILGWGSGIGSLLTKAGPDDLLGQSLQSGYMHTLLRGGLLLFCVTYSTLIFAVIWGLGKNKRLWYQYRWPVAIIVFYGVSSLVRTYSVGGLGLLPIMLGLATSACLYARF